MRYNLGGMLFNFPGIVVFGLALLGNGGLSVTWRNICAILRLPGSPDGKTALQLGTVSQSTTSIAHLNSTVKAKDASQISKLTLNTIFGNID
jgi:hypothetical protein